jgi:hypothetical protein
MRHDKKKPACAPAKEVKFDIVLSGDQEVPPVETTGRGHGRAYLSKDRHTLYFRIEFSDLSSPVQEPAPGLGWAHFHRAPAGQNGPVVKNITCDFHISQDGKCGKAKGEWDCSDWDSLTHEMVEALLADEIYVNIHTAAHPAGEIRGQLIKK